MIPILTRQQTHNAGGPRGGTLDASWPRIPVAHLSHETDTSFSTIHCFTR
jgi:hypothetical protein